MQRSLEKLGSKGIITEKINGKQKVYAPKQVSSIKILFFTSIIIVRLLYLKLGDFLRIIDLLNPHSKLWENGKGMIY